jgi:hypothetical protein
VVVLPRDAGERGELCGEVCVTSKLTGSELRPSQRPPGMVSGLTISAWLPVLENGERESWAIIGLGPWPVLGRFSLCE